MLTSKVELVDGNNTYEGRVEITYGRIKGTVCDNGWDDNDAAVVCRMLGYTGGTALKGPEDYHGHSFGYGTGPILLDDVECSGNEQTLLECKHRGIGIHNCGHNEDAGVICDDNRDILSLRGDLLKSLDVLTNGVTFLEQNIKGLNDVRESVREPLPQIWDKLNLIQDRINSVQDRLVVLTSTVELVDGRNTYEGRVEITYMKGRRNGTVCDDDWDDNDAAVVCRMLGYTRGTALKGPGENNGHSFGQGTGETLLDNVQCAGNELSLFDCKHRGIGIHNCGHVEDAGVRCDP